MQIVNWQVGWRRSETMKNQKHILVAQLFMPSDAHILKGLLEAENITVFIFDEGFSSLTPADALISGGIKLHVPFEQREKAKKIVDKFYENLKEESTLKCSNCNSTNLKHDYVEHFKYGFINLISAFAGANASHGTRHYKRCLDCGYRVLIFRKSSYYILHP